MSNEFRPGDLVTTLNRGDDRLHADEAVMIARRPGSWAWDLWLPRSSIMTVIGIAPSSFHGAQDIATVLRDGQMLEVFTNDLRRVEGEDS